MTQDAQGHLLSGARVDAVTAYDGAMSNLHGDAIGQFDAARQAAPEFAMAHLAKAWVLTVANDRGLMTQARTLIETVRPLALNEREQAHFAALSRVVLGHARLPSPCWTAIDELPLRPAGASVPAREAPC